MRRMDIFDKYAGIATRRAKLLEAGADPFNLQMETMHGPTEATIAGRRTILVGTNNYLGLTFDPACIEAASATPQPTFIVQSCPRCPRPTGSP